MDELTTVREATVHRFEVRPHEAAGDPLGDRIVRDAEAALGLRPSSVRTAKLYVVVGAVDDGGASELLDRVLVDPVLERGVIGATGARAGERVIEVWPLPGVMDPPGQTIGAAAASLLGREASELEVKTGLRYDVGGLGAAEIERLATRVLANAVIERVHYEPWVPTELPHLPPVDQTVRRVAIRDLDDKGLAALSASGHLFLNVVEMRAIRDHFVALGRDPTDVELETLAQTWSEHCVHKTLKSRVTYRESGHRDGGQIDRGSAFSFDPAALPGAVTNPDGSVTIDNLLRSTVAAATYELTSDDIGIDWTLSVFVDNSGVVRFDDEHAVCVKVETHNRPSAIEPYGGAATGIGGCIRDVIGTGLGAKPIASTDVFCVADPGRWVAGEPAGALGDRESPSGDGSIDGVGPGAARVLPPGVLHPRRILTRVVDGVRDYGNRMGIPTVNGAVHFDDRYVGNPLVFCGCIGVMPAWAAKGEVRPGDRIIALGGRTGRDGIHGATFSSGELTSTHADEFSHAVQIGNAIEEKRVLDAIVRARDVVAVGASGTRHQALGRNDTPKARPLFSGLTDCGAGGFSSAIGEMGERVGAVVDLERAPLKYTGLRYDEVWISESQERMVLAVPAENVAALRAICDEEGVEMADLGVFGHRSAETGEPELLLRWEGQDVGRVAMPFLHDGLPMPTREAVWSTGAAQLAAQMRPGPGQRSTLRSLLSHPNIASRRWIVRQYDHEVQGNTVVKPLGGPSGEAPMDASVVAPVAGSTRGVAIACGMASELGNTHPDGSVGDPYRMAIGAIDECVRNLVCVGADPERIAILDNFCWPSCDDPQHMAALVRACAGCYDAAKAYRTPFVSGKDSLNNQFRWTDPETGESRLIEIPYTLLITGIGMVDDVSRCVTSELKRAEDTVVVELADEGPVAARRAHELIASGEVLAAHDVSDGGLLVAVAEMALGADRLGLRLERDDVDTEWNTIGRYALQVTRACAHAHGLPVVAGVIGEPVVVLAGGERLDVEELREAFLSGFPLGSD
ncbi:MAG: AIR synthase-related protein [Planctomycetota bacterium]